MESESVDENSCSSDDSFCEHGYPLHEEPPTIEKVCDKAVITVQEQGNEEDQQMFLIPFMKGESPLNEALKQIVDLNYRPDKNSLKTLLLDQKDHITNNKTMSAVENTVVSDADISNDVEAKTDSENSNSSQDDDVDAERGNSLEEVGETKLCKDNESSDKEMKEATFKDPEYHKTMMSDLSSNQVEEKIKEISESVEGVKTESDTTKAPEDQVKDYNKLLSELSTAMDDSLKDSSVDGEGKDKPFVCTVCEWRFSTESDLNNHKRLHSGERPYQCEYCIANFQDKTALLNHRRQHTDGYHRHGLDARLKRYLLYNPADMSTAIGYKNHTIHDMGSLVNEASSNAHGGAGSSPYNVPNFPSMGNNGVQLQPGSVGTPGSSSSSVSGTSASSGSGSASFAGTNQWRCDSHIVAQCDTQCLDVDPKDGCPFCIPGCTGTGTSSTGSSSQAGSSPGSGNQSFNQSGSSSQSGSSAGMSGSGSGSPFGLPASAPFGNQPSAGLSQASGTLSGSGSNLQGSAGQNPGTLTGTNGQGQGSQSGGTLGGTLGQLPSGLAGTGSQGSNQGPTGSGSAPGASSCPYYPPNCPKTYTTLENGCLTCTLLKQLNLNPPQQGIQFKPTSGSITTAAKVTCAPTRCVAPCNKGIVLASDGCPRCKCPAYT